MTIDPAMADAVQLLTRDRLARVKRAFTTRRVAAGDMRTLLSGPLKPRSGDLVMARVDELGKHRRIELPDGRRATIFPGDEIIVCFGNRYAPDQFEAVIGGDLGSCDLVAGGGIAACELSRHDRMTEPTRISPIGLVGDGAGNRLNVRDFALPNHEGVTAPSIVTVLSVGTSMNAGKTLAATSLLHGLKAGGFRVAGIKATGTGSGGDLWIMRDAGADLVLDFTDAGFASTYLAPVAALEAATLHLISHAASMGCDVAVVEIADGLQQVETAALIRSERLRLAVTGVVFSAYDAMGAMFGVDTLRAAGHRVIGLSGRLAQSPLGMREAESATGLRVYTPWQLQSGALVPQVMAINDRDETVRMSRAPLGGAAKAVRSDAIANDPNGGESATALSGSQNVEHPATPRIAFLRMRRMVEHIKALRVGPLHVVDAGLKGVCELSRRRARQFGVTSIDVFDRFKANGRRQLLALRPFGSTTEDSVADHAVTPGSPGRFPAVTAESARAADRELRVENVVRTGACQARKPDWLAFHDGRHAIGPSSSHIRNGGGFPTRCGPARSGHGDDVDDPADTADDIGYAADAAGYDEGEPIHEWAIPSRGAHVAGSECAKAG